MKIENVKQYDDLSFEDYLQIPRISFSSLKDSPITVETPGIRIGSLVHRYLLSPQLYNYEEADVVIPIASALVGFVGRACLKGMICEKPMTADFVYEGFSLPWKGVPDMKYPEVIVVDFKVIAGDLEHYCDRFDYPEQIRGYMLPNNVDVGLIIAYNRKRKIVQTKTVYKDTKWWAIKVMSHGQPIKKTA